LALNPNFIRLQLRLALLFAANRTAIEVPAANLRLDRSRMQPLGYFGHAFDMLKRYP